MHLIKLLSLCGLLLLENLSFANVLDHFNHIKSDPNALYAFLKEMPKGGELHYHLAGGAYPESMLDIASKNKNFCINLKSFNINNDSNCQGVKSPDIFRQPHLYNQIIKAWSMKDFIPGSESASEHFFSTFYKFYPIVSENSPELLAEVLFRAAQQHENYLEIMIMPDNGNSAQALDLPVIPANFEKIKQKLLSDSKFKAGINHTVEAADALIPATKKLMQCDKYVYKDECNLTIKFQYHVLREQALDHVFSQALNAFAASNQSKALVGVNLVQAEDGLISLRDYHQQMQIFKFMHKAFPKVHIALHAGELAPSAVRPEELRFHIFDAIHTGQAERIGHGVAIAFEERGEQLIEYMGKHSIPVEINLTSNQVILGVFGVNHPLNYYLAHHVPVVLSSDDEGILRTDLTRQFVEAVITHNIDYSTLKRINRNTLIYSFLSGKSLWEDIDSEKRVKDCENLHSPACSSFISNNEKAALQYRLELKLNAFESRYN